MIGEENGVCGSFHEAAVFLFAFAQGDCGGCDGGCIEDIAVQCLFFRCGCGGRSQAGLGPSRAAVRAQNLELEFKA